MKQLFVLCLIALTLLAGCSEDVALAVGAQDHNNRYRVELYDCAFEVGDTVNIYETRRKKLKNFTEFYIPCWTMFAPAGQYKSGIPVIITDLPGCNSDTVKDLPPSRNRLHYKNEVRTDESRESTEISLEVK